MDLVHFLLHLSKVFYVHCFWKWGPFIPMLYSKWWFFYVWQAIHVFRLILKLAQLTELYHFKKNSYFSLRCSWQTGSCQFQVYSTAILQSHTSGTAQPGRCRCCPCSLFRTVFHVIFSSSASVRSYPQPAALMFLHFDPAWLFFLSDEGGGYITAPDPCQRGGLHLISLTLIGMCSMCS